MTAEKVIERALLLEGYWDKLGNADMDRYLRAGMEAIKVLYKDMCILNGKHGEIVTVKDELELNDREESTLIYGVAALIAKSVGDTDNQTFFAYMYNTQRKALCEQSTYEDVLPAV